jgi:hypothetical protein
MSESVIKQMNARSRKAHHATLRNALSRQGVVDKVGPRQVCSKRFGLFFAGIIDIGHSQTGKYRSLLFKRSLRDYLKNHMRNRVQIREEMSQTVIIAVEGGGAAMTGWPLAYLCEEVID